MSPPHLRPKLPAYDIVTELERIPPDLRGMHAANPVNLPPAAACRSSCRRAPRFEPDVVGLGGRADAAHRSADRRSRRRRRNVARPVAPSSPGATGPNAR